MDFYHYRVVVYTHCQHTFQFKLIVKVHVASYDPFKLVVYSDSSMGNLPDGGTQGGHFIMLMGEIGNSPLYPGSQNASGELYGVP